MIGEIIFWGAITLTVSICISYLLYQYVTGEMDEGS